MARKIPLYQRVGIVYNPDKPRAHVEFGRLKRWLQGQGIQVSGGPRVIPAIKQCQFVIVLGGDGTVLQVARAVAPWAVPIFGVNVGRLGFLAATEVQAMMRTLQRVLAGQGRLESRTLLSVTGTVGGKKFGPALALNDCVLRSGATGRVLRLQAHLREKPLASYAGDGLIVATPTGSTAYSLAASGPIIYPELDVLLLSPICPHTLAQRPLVIPTFEIIQIEVDRPGPSAILCLDGLVVQTLHPGDRVEIRRAAEQIQLLTDPERSFYQVLQSKLKWGGA